MHIGERIKEIRTSKNITLLEIAEFLGVTEATVQRYESGNIKNLKLDTIGKIASYLKVDPAYLMGWKDEGNYDSFFEYPYYPVSISAGVPLDVTGVTRSDVVTVKVSDAIMGKWARSKDISMMKVNGDSMNNVIPHGSLIAIKQVELSNLKNGDLIVYSNGHDYSLKRFYKDNDRLIFRPDSTDARYTDYVTTVYDENLKIHGKVVVYIIELD